MLNLSRTGVKWLGALTRSSRAGVESEPCLWRGSGLGGEVEVLPWLEWSIPAGCSYDGSGSRSGGGQPLGGLDALPTS